MDYTEPTCDFDGQVIRRIILQRDTHQLIGMKDKFEHVLPRSLAPDGYKAEKTYNTHHSIDASTLFNNKTTYGGGWMEHNHYD